MKTKFSQILKLKLNIVNKIEFEILQINNEILAKKRDIEALEILISEFSPPQKSDKYSEFLNFKESVNNIRNKILEENNFLSMLESRKIDTLKRFNKAKIEYEKINYLHLQAIQELLKKARRLEILELDEIARNKYITQKKAEQWERL